VAPLKRQNALTKLVLPYYLFVHCHTICSFIAILSVRSLNMTLFVNLSQSKPARGHNMWSEREVEEQATKLCQACINWSQQRNLKPCFELY